MNTREEHLKWCKERAMEYVNAGDYQQGVTSMLSDLGQHPDTKSSVGVGAMLMLTVRDRDSAKRFVEGFNYRDLLSGPLLYLRRPFFA